MIALLLWSSGSATLGREKVVIALDCWLPVMFCGDDTGAVVGEVAGYQSLFGNGGESVPKYMIPSYIACGGGGSGGRKAKRAGDLALGYHGLLGAELKNPMKDGDIYDWDCVEELWRTFYANRERGESRESPALVVLPSWAPLKDVEKYAEIMYETFAVPHAYFQRKSVASAFAAGRPTALVLDSGYQSSSAVPVFEGHVLFKGIRRSRLSGDLLTREMLKHIESTGAKVRPSFMFTRHKNEQSGLESTLDADYSNIHSTYVDYCQSEIAKDAKEYFCTMPRTPFDEKLAARVPPDMFELPDGTSVNLTLGRYTVPELLMNTTPLKEVLPPGTVGDHLLSLPELISTSLLSSSVDIRRNLANNCVLAGGNTCYKGIQTRLNLECNLLLPKAINMRFVSPSKLEARVSAWTGGSVLASLGSFQQLWVSKQEYEEHGGKILAERCWT